MTYIIRSVTSEDLPAMFRISVSAHQSGYASFIPKSGRKLFDERFCITPETEQDYTKTLIQRLKDPTWSFWLAEENNKVLGYTLMQQVSDDLFHIAGMFVHPDHQGEGIGSSLMRVLINSVEKGTIELFVITSNDRAKHIYEKSGFAFASVRQERYFDAKQDIMTLKKSLAK